MFDASFLELCSVVVLEGLGLPLALRTEEEGKGLCTNGDGITDGIPQSTLGCRERKNPSIKSEATELQAYHSEVAF